MERVCRGISDLIRGCSHRVPLGLGGSRGPLTAEQMTAEAVVLCETSFNFPLSLYRQLSGEKYERRHGRYALAYQKDLQRGH